MEVGDGHAMLEVQGHRADVFLSRPAKRNAMTVPVMEDLREAVERADANDAVRAITLLGEGPVFCAGMDLEMMRARADHDSDIDREAFPRLLKAIDTTTVPTVAAIKRAAPAGAFELTLPCDFRVLGSEAKYGLLEVQLGTFPHGGATQRLPRLVGLAKAKEFVLTGEFIDPAEAERCGLVYDVVPDDEVDSRARELADSLSENAPLGMANAKEALDAALEVPLEEGLRYERMLGRELDGTRDYREGFEARLEDREPTFEGC